MVTITFRNPVDGTSFDVQLEDEKFDVIEQWRAAEGLTLDQAFDRILSTGILAAEAALSQIDRREL